MIQKQNTCQTCDYFSRFGMETKGQCYANPPTPLPNGSMMRAQVKIDDRACSKHKALPEGVEGHIKQKKQPDTVGQAIKAKRQEKQNQAATTENQAPQ